MSESNLRKCMCCGRMVSHIHTYCSPGPESVHHAEWCVDVLDLCSDCNREWIQHFPPDLAEKERDKILSNANKWLFEKVAKQLEKSHKKFKIKGFHHTEVQGRRHCIGEYEAANLQEAMIKFFDEYPTVDEILDAKEVKEEKNEAM